MKKRLISFTAFAGLAPAHGTAQQSEMRIELEKQLEGIRAAVRTRP